MFANHASWCSQVKRSLVGADLRVCPNLTAPPEAAAIWRKLNALMPLSQIGQPCRDISKLIRQIRQTPLAKRQRLASTENPAKAGSQQPPPGGLILLAGWLLASGVKPPSIAKLHYRIHSLIDRSGHDSVVSLQPPSFYRRLHKRTANLFSSNDKVFQPPHATFAFSNLTPASLHSTPPLHAVERGLGGEVYTTFIQKGGTTLAGWHLSEDTASFVFSILTGQAHRSSPTTPREAISCCQTK